MMDDIKRKVEDARVSASQNTNVRPQDPTPQPTKNPFDNMARIFGTLGERMQTIHKKDFGQHADVIRGDLLHLVDLVPKNDVTSKLRSILNSS